MMKIDKFTGSNSNDVRDRTMEALAALAAELGLIVPTPTGQGWQL